MLEAQPRAFTRWRYQTPPGSEEGSNGYLRSMEEYGANWVFGVRGSF